MINKPKELEKAIEIMKSVTSSIPVAEILSDLLAAPYEEEEIIFENFIEKATIVMMVGKSKLGKTQLALQLGLSCAAGINFFELITAKPIRVLYVNSELRSSKIRQRIKTILNHVDFILTNLDKNPPESPPEEIAGKNFSILNLRGCITGKIEEIVQYIIDAGKDHSADLIIFDPLYLLIDGNENDTSVAKNTCQMMNNIVAQTGACLLYVHHDTKGNVGDKNNIDRGSGSGLLGRHYDASLILTEHANEPGVLVIEGENRDYAQLEKFCVQRDGQRFVSSQLSVEKRTNKSDRAGKLSSTQIEEYIDEGIKILQNHNDPDKPISTKKLRELLKSNHSNLSIRKAEQIQRSIDEKLKLQQNELGIQQIRKGNNHFVYVSVVRQN